MTVTTRTPQLIASSETEPSSAVNSHANSAAMQRSATNLNRVSGLLSGLIEDQSIATEKQTIESSYGTSREALLGHRFENDLAMVRLGIATSLFYALRIKHPPAASHSLRVAISCSVWAERLGLDRMTRDRLEVAALMHDIGKIGVPDAILKKPSRLDIEERSTVEICPLLSVHILKGCTQDQELLEMIEYCHHWYMNRREQATRQGEQLPLGARIIAIAEAFDSMITETVYRPAMSRERALVEIAKYAGTQFDPRLATDFHRMLEAHPEYLHHGSIDRWLKTLRMPHTSDLRWSRDQNPQAAIAHQGDTTDGYFLQLLRHTNDGVAFIDSDGIIREWNTTLHQITGIRDEAVLGNHWHPDLLGFTDRDGDPLSLETCPIAQALKHGSCATHSIYIHPDRAGNSPLTINLRITGVTEPHGGIRGVVAIFQDASRQKSLEKYVEDLNAKAAQDPLTGVSNRAELDRELQALIESASKGEINFSLIMTDIDHFKSVNDTYGHPAGDEAIIQFARILSNQSRDGDIVARYGGEEFVVLCVHCDNITAAKRAEEMRLALEQTRLSFLQHDVITASFGVTQFQGGDTAESVLARADRALLRAKENGRNRVIQLGTGGFLPFAPQEEETRPTSWFGFFRRRRLCGEKRVEFRTPVPLDLVIEKVRGYMADHQVVIVQISGSSIQLKLNIPIKTTTSRRADRRMEFQVDLEFYEESTSFETPMGQLVERTETIVKTLVAAVESGDRRSGELEKAINQVLAGLRSYLMVDF